MIIDLNRNRSLPRRQPLQDDTITPATAETARTGMRSRYGSTAETKVKTSRDRNYANTFFDKH